MATPTELARVAAQANALRPDWPTRSVLTYLEQHHTARAYRDLAVAMAYVATDAKTQTPKRLGESGPWWHATGEATPTAVPAANDPRCTVYGHEHYRIPCRGCRADELLAGTVRPARNLRGVRAVLDAAPALDPARLAAGERDETDE